MFITSDNFDMKLGSILKNKISDNVVRARFDIQKIQHRAKLNFINDLIDSTNAVSITYKILFWEKSCKIIELPLFGEESKYLIRNEYNGGEFPGIVFLDSCKVNKDLLFNLLTNHFNYEQAKDPGLNIRLQIYIEYNCNAQLFDIYDDRGFDLYYLMKV